TGWGAGRAPALDRGKPMAIGRNRAQHQAVADTDGMEIDAVEVIPGLFGGNRELGLLNQTFEIGSADREFVGQFAGCKVRKITLRQGLQREPRAPRTNGDHGAVTRRLQHDLGALRQLADNLVEHMGRHRGGAAGVDLGCQSFGDFEIEIGSLQGELGNLGTQQHIGENWNRVATLDHAMHMGQRLEQVGAFDRNLHAEPRLLWHLSPGAKTVQRWRLDITRKLPRQCRFDKSFRGIKMAARTRNRAGFEQLQPRSRPGAGRHSCNWLFNTSISAARVLSTPISDSILRTACRTVVWSRPPKRRPISGNERNVSVLARYMAI